MENKIFKPMFDKMYWWILGVTSALLLGFTIATFFAPLMLILSIPVDLFTVYFLVSPIFGYVELRENSLFIKFGLILKREIPYSDIKAVDKESKCYSESMLSLKNSLEHLNIKYGSFGVATVSVVGNDELKAEIEKRIA